MNASISARLASGSPVPRARWPSRRWGSTTAPRADDPLLHTHLVVANRVQDPDGRWTALDGRDLYRHRRAADAVYRAAYQRVLTRSLGVAWTTADQHGNRELKGVPAGLIRVFSQRPRRSPSRSSGSRPRAERGRPGWCSGPSTPPRKAKAHEAPETLYARGGPRRLSAAATPTSSSAR
jgi:TrwC relaxase